MNRLLTSLWYVASGAILLILVALLLWYLVLKSSTDSTAVEDALRGAGEEAPTFGGGTGSTYENIISSAVSLIRPPTEKTQMLPRLAQISKTPTAGAGFVQSGTTTRLRFVERSTGYVLESGTDTPLLTRLTNTLAPRTYEAVVGTKNIFMQALEEDGRITTTFGVPASTTSETSATFVGKKLPDGIRSLALGPEENEVVYVIETREGGAAVMRRTLSTGKEIQIFSSPLRRWKILWAADGSAKTGNRIILVQNASSEASGYAYQLKDGARTPVIGGATGLTILPHPTLPALVYGIRGETIYARVSDSASILTLPLRTTPEKCVWSSASATAMAGTAGKNLVLFCAVPQRPLGAGFIDRWYRGEAHTSDAWWRIDVSANSAELLYTPANVDLDVEKPIIDKSGNYVAFMNARDKSLWLLRIAE